MPSCTTCPNRTGHEKSAAQKKVEEKKGTIRFYKFPSNEEICQKWEAFVNNQKNKNDWKANKFSRLCSDHFEESCFTTLWNQRKLRDDSIPTISKSEVISRRLMNDIPEIEKQNDVGILAKKKPLDQTVSKLKSKIKFKEKTKPKTDSKLYDEPSKDGEIESISVKKPEESIVVVVINETEAGIIPIKEDKSTSTTKISCQNKATCISPKTKKIWNETERERKLKRINDIQARKIKILHQKLRRKDKKLAEMKNVIDANRKKKLMRNKNLDVLKCLGEANQDLIKRQIKKSNSEPSQNKYSLELRDFASTLHYYSPRAYRFVRKQFNSCLPHPKTIAKSYCNVNELPNLTEESFKGEEARSQIDNEEREEDKNEV